MGFSTLGVPSQPSPLLYARFLYCIQPPQPGARQPLGLFRPLGGGQEEQVQVGGAGSGFDAIRCHSMPFNGNPRCYLRGSATLLSTEPLNSLNKL